MFSLFFIVKSNLLFTKNLVKKYFAINSAKPIDIVGIVCYYDNTIKINPAFNRGEVLIIFERRKSIWHFTIQLHKQ